MLINVGRLKSVQKKSSGAPWPSGKDGALTVMSGQIYHLTPGRAYDFTTVDIQEGGALAATIGASPVMIGVTTSINISGDCFFSNNPNYTTTINQTAPDGFMLSGTIACNLGAGGGQSGGASRFGISGFGGSHFEGNGGGGGGQEDADDASVSSGGEGGLGSSESQGMIPGGAPGTDMTSDPGGQSGMAAFAFSSIFLAYGSGGGGGYRGFCGQFVYFKILGTSTGEGNVYAVGQSGGSGGGGGGASDDGNSGSLGGGGGGGGSGGGGGYVVIRYNGSNSAPIWNVSTESGSGGNGGGGGQISSESDVSLGGNDGDTGDSGVEGTIDIAAY